MKTRIEKSAINNFLPTTNYQQRTTNGSAIILAVVLTSLLAIVAVTFLMVARVNKTGSSAISENRELNHAVDTVIAKISQQFVLDVPGTTYPAGPNDPNLITAEYYDYPGISDNWLASLEPYGSGGYYFWRHISDVYNSLGAGANVDANIVPDYQNTISPMLPADADGDGVATAGG